MLSGSEKLRLLIYDLLILKLAVGMDEAHTKGKAEIGEKALEGREQLLSTHESLICFLEGKQRVSECSKVCHS